jgi:hypothetical protein
MFLFVTGTGKSANMFKPKAYCPLGAKFAALYAAATHGGYTITKEQHTWLE